MHLLGWVEYSNCNIISIVLIIILDLTGLMPEIQQTMYNHLMDFLLIILGLSIYITKLL